MMDVSVCRNKKGPQTSRVLMPYVSVPQLAVVDCLRDTAGITIGVPVSNPFRDRARRYFEVLGVDPEKLKDPGYIEYQLGLDIDGREVSFGTKDEEYNGRHSVKVVWIGRKSEPDLSRSAARFFSSSAAADSVTGEQTPF